MTFRRERYPKNDNAARRKASRAARHGATTLPGLVALALAACAPVDDPPPCAIGQSEACTERCRTGTLRTNLPTRRTCVDTDSGPAWGPCACAVPP